MTGVNDAKDRSFRSCGTVKGIFTTACQLLGIHLSATQLEQFEALCQMLLEWNERMSLTGIKEPTRIAIEHFVDSLAPIAFGLLRDGASLIDVGTGAGFPGLPIAIAAPGILVALLDASYKKMVFLNAVRERIGLTNVELLHGRAEEFAHRPECREAYDIAVARAFGRIDVVLECCMPFVKVGGRAIAYKGPSVFSELSFGKIAARELGGAIVDVIEFKLPTTELKRTLVIVEKLEPTAHRYPRRPGIPEKRPLGNILKR